MGGRKETRRKCVSSNYLIVQKKDLKLSAVCLSSKYGCNCKFRNNCSKTHFSDICEIPVCSGYKCDKRHPKDCFFFKNYGRCKFGSYCTYKHVLSTEIKLEEEVNALKSEMKTLKTDLETMKK